MVRHRRGIRHRRRVNKKINAFVVRLFQEIKNINKNVVRLEQEPEDNVYLRLIYLHKDVRLDFRLWGKNEDQFYLILFLGEAEMNYKLEFDLGLLLFEGDDNYTWVLRRRTNPDNPGVLHANGLDLEEVEENLRNRLKINHQIINKTRYGCNNGYFLAYNEDFSVLSNRFNNIINDRISYLYPINN